MYRRQRRHLQYIMVVKFRNTIWPPQLQLSLLRRAALSSNSNGTRSYIAERTQSAVYIVRCLWCPLISSLQRSGGLSLYSLCPALLHGVHTQLSAQLLFRKYNKKYPKSTHPNTVLNTWRAPSNRCSVMGTYTCCAVLRVNPVSL
jgi:hypothetical protein